MVRKNISIPQEVEFIIKTLQNKGFEAYAVGGCVRDSILGKTPDDWDITTSAMARDVKELFSRTIDTGIQHGTVTVMLDKEGFEVTTYRIDGEYADGRHPREVLFIRDLKEDLRRRDFTINAMAYNQDEGLIDIFGGMEDIRLKTIRCVGNAEERFTEDALRILRAVRFSSQLGFSIEEKTKKGMKKLVENLALISQERIQVELVKLLISDHPEGLKTAYETGITKIILPEFDQMMETDQITPYHCYTVGEHTLHALKEIPNDKVLRLAVLFHDVGKPQVKTVDSEGKTHFYGHEEAGAEITKNILKGLRFDNDTLDKVTRLVKWHDIQISLTPKGVRRAIFKVGEELFPSLLKVKKADIMAQSTYKREEKLAELETVSDLYEEIIKARECISLKELKISGSDIMKEGLKPGREIGEILACLLDMVIDNPAYNEKQYLLQKVREIIRTKKS